MEIKIVAVSACLLGENCKYNGGNNRKDFLLKWLEDKKVIAICPEVLGGLSTPRVPSEIVDGVVTMNTGACVHKEFVSGAKKALDILKEYDVDLVILQSRSPSCGVKEVYDGTFTKTLVKGQGIFTKMAIEAGYQVMDIEDFLEQWRNA